MLYLIETEWRILFVQSLDIIVPADALVQNGGPVLNTKLYMLFSYPFISIFRIYFNFLVAWHLIKGFIWDHGMHN